MEKDSGAVARTYTYVSITTLAPLRLTSRAHINNSWAWGYQPTRESRQGSKPESPNDFEDTTSALVPGLILNLGLGCY